MPRRKRPKREMKNGGGMLNCFFFFIMCVCVPFTIAKQQQLLRSCVIVSLRLTGSVAFFRFHERLTQNYALKSGEKISSDDILKVN